MDNLKYQNIKTFRMQEGFRGKSIFVVQLWQFIQSIFFRFSPRFMNGWRRFLLRLFGASIGKKVLIRPSAKILYPWKLKIGDYSWIGDDVNIYNMENVNIGKNTVISQKSYLCTGSHDYKNTSFRIFAEPIEIEDEVWIATDVFIAPNVKIGSGTVVGYRSVVTKNLPPKMICIGSPAKPIKSR